MTPCARPKAAVRITLCAVGPGGGPAGAGALSGGGGEDFGSCYLSHSRIL